jgi:hypothetical protein
VDANANAVPSISSTMAAVPDVETTAADEQLERTATAMTEPTASILPGSATFPECTKPRRSRFGPLLQVWHEWSSRSAVSQQASCHRIRKPVTTSRTAELHLR